LVAPSGLTLCRSAASGALHRSESTRCFRAARRLQRLLAGLSVISNSLARIRVAKQSSQVRGAETCAESQPSLRIGSGATNRQMRCPGSGHSQETLSRWSMCLDQSGTSLSIRQSHQRHSPVHCAALHGHPERNSIVASGTERGYPFWLIKNARASDVNV
jgi:hypothetical protein